MPARHALGALQAEQGLHASAIAVYKEDLAPGGGRPGPANPWALAGLVSRAMIAAIAIRAGFFQECQQLIVRTGNVARGCRRGCGGGRGGEGGAGEGERERGHGGAGELRVRGDGQGLRLRG